MTKIIECTCKHKSQDEMYGVGRRVFNLALAKNPGIQKWRCTVCNREVELPKDK